MPRSGLTGSRPDVDSGAAFVADELLVAPVGSDGFDVSPCPPRLRPTAHRLAAETTATVALRTVDPARVPRPRLDLVGRNDERTRIAELLAARRPVHLTAPSGAGRTALLAAVAADSAGLAADGTVELDGTGRSAEDLAHELFTATHRTASQAGADPAWRPGPARLRTLLAGIGAVVLVDDADLTAEDREWLIGLAPECVFVFASAAGPAPAAGRRAAPAPAADPDPSRPAEVRLGGLPRAEAVRLLERRLARPLMGAEQDWAADLWFESEGLPLRAVQAAAVLRARDARGVPHGEDLPPVARAAAPAGLLAADLSTGARELLRLAAALDGELPAAVHLPALTGAEEGADAVAELVEAGLATPAGPGHRLAAHVLPAATPDPRTVEALTAHYLWFSGNAGVAPRQVAAEAEAILAAMAAARAAEQHRAVAALARAAGPAFAAALRWDAWRRALRLGAEAAVREGNSTGEAYFRHELSVHALVTGDLETARGESERAQALRAAVGDRAAGLSRRVREACGSTGGELALHEGSPEDTVPGAAAPPDPRAESWPEPPAADAAAGGEAGESTEEGPDEDSPVAWPAVSYTVLPGDTPVAGTTGVGLPSIPPAPSAPAAPGAGGAAAGAAFGLAGVGLTAVGDEGPEVRIGGAHAGPRKRVRRRSVALAVSAVLVVAAGTLLSVKLLTGGDADHGNPDRVVAPTGTPSGPASGSDASASAPSSPATPAAPVDDGSPSTSASPSDSASPTASPTSSGTHSHSPTGTPSHTPKPTHKPKPTPSRKPSHSPTPSNSPTPTRSPSPTASPTPSDTTGNTATP